MNKTIEASVGEKISIDLARVCSCGKENTASWTLWKSSLPEGLELNRENGYIEGTCRKACLKTNTICYEGAGLEKGICNITFLIRGGAGEGELFIRQTKTEGRLFSEDLLIAGKFPIHNFEDKLVREYEQSKTGEAGVLDSCFDNYIYVRAKNCTEKNVEGRTVGLYYAKQEEVLYPSKWMPLKTISGEWRAAFPPAKAGEVVTAKEAFVFENLNWKSGSVSLIAWLPSNLEIEPLSEKYFIKSGTCGVTERVAVRGCLCWQSKFSQEIQADETGYYRIELQGIADGVIKILVIADRDDFHGNEMWYVGEKELWRTIIFLEKGRKIKFSIYLQAVTQKDLENAYATLAYEKVERV